MDGANLLPKLETKTIDGIVFHSEECIGTERKNHSLVVV